MDCLNLFDKPVCPAGTTAKTPMISRFLYTDLYVALYALLVFVCWYAKAEIACVVISILLGCGILCLQADTMPLLPILFCVVYTFPSNVDPLSYKNIMPILALIPIAIVLHFVKYPLKRKKFGMFFPQIAVSVALLLGGAGYLSDQRYLAGLPFALLLGFAILVLYIAVGSTYCPPAEVNSKRYVMSSLMFMGIVLGLETMVFFMRTQQPIAHWMLYNLDLGWGISNNVATMLLLAAPSAFYLAMTSKKLAPVYIVVGLLEFLAIVFTFSRGGILAGLVIILPTVLYPIISKRTANKRLYAISVAAIAILALVFLVVTRQYWLDLVHTTFKNGMDPSGRDKLYAEAWQGFHDKPLFGLGIGFLGNHFRLPNMPMYWFHSTFFQVIGCMGVIGLAAYAYNYAARFFIVMRLKPFHIILFLCMFGFEGYSMIDTGTFVPIPSMMVVLLLTLTAEVENDRDDKYAYSPVRGVKLNPALLHNILYVREAEI